VSEEKAVGSSDIKQKIQTFFRQVTSREHHRYRSWEHCYLYFRSKEPHEFLQDKANAALQLGFYLASWGMYRGSSFLLQHDYKIHERVIERVTSPEFIELWRTEIGQRKSDDFFVDVILTAVSAVKDAYAPYGKATDTLATKVLLGMLACVPACDRYFIDGFKQAGYQYSYFNKSFVKRVIQFCTDNRQDLREVQEDISRAGSKYPLMKLADMYFWQSGYEAAEQKKSAGLRR
jgi:hypothetical protein